MSAPESAPPPLSPQVIPYATPIPYQSDEGAWREGALLVVRKEASLPTRCVKCNAQVDVNDRWRRKMYWAPPALALLVLVGLPGILIYIIVVLCIRQTAVVEASICPRHRRRRSNFIISTWIATIAALASLAAGVTIAVSSKDPTPGV